MCIRDRYTLTGATTTIDLEDNTNGEIVEIDDQYAWKMGGKDNTWFGIGDADGILADSKKVTYEVEVMFDTTNLNDRFFFCFGDEEGWHGVNDKTEDPYFNGFAAHGNWKPTPKVGEWGVCTMTTDKFDPTKVDGDMIAKIGNWVVDGSLYIRSLKAYDTEDPTKVVSIEFAKKDAPAPENALTFAPNEDVTLNADGAYVFPGDWKTLTLVNNTSVIAAGEKELTVEVQYTLDAPATADATFPNELFMIAKGEGSENESSYNPGTVEGAVRDGKTLNSYTLKITANYGTDNLFFKYGNGTKLNLSYAKIYATDAPEQYLEFGEKKGGSEEPPVPEKMPILVVDDMDDAAKYGGNVTLDKTNKKQGVGAIMNSSANNWAGIQANDNSLNVDFSKLPENWLDTYYVEAWLYVSDVTAITPGSCLELSEVQDEIELQYELASLQGLTNGWNKIQIPVKNMGDSAGQVKTIKKMRLFCVNLTKDLTVGLDDIVLTPYAGAANTSDYGKQETAKLADAVAEAEKADTSKWTTDQKATLKAAIDAAKAINGDEATVRDVLVAAEALAEALKVTTPTDPTKPDPTETEPDPTETEPDPTETEPDPTETEPDPTEKPIETKPEPTDDPVETDPSNEETEPSNEEPAETVAPTTEALPGETETGEASAVLPVALLAVAAAAVSAVVLKKKEQK